MARSVLLVALLVLAGCASEEAEDDAATSCVVETDLARIDVKIARGEHDVKDADVVAWIERAARALNTYLHTSAHEPIALHVGWHEGEGVGNGVTLAQDGVATIRVSVGRSATKSQLEEDWVLTHEMVHASFPDVLGPHRWVEEGLATYVEPIARCRAGQLSAARVWADVLATYAQGLPERGDPGLDHNDSWARTYYGGAIFWLLADVRIRERTKNARGLEDALRAVVEAGGVVTASWDAERVFATADRGAEVAVLGPLNDRLKDAAGDVDLEALFKDLGAELRDGKVVFHDDAPLAAIRRAITNS